jgi:hypothetical protein
MGVIVRGFIVIFGLLTMLLGIVVIATTGEARIAGLTWVAIGGVIVVLVAAERQRYRSGAAEKTNAPPGPGGGERRGEMVEPRFQTTGEVFLDPSTGHRMRVLVDPATGDRRYVAEE